MTSKLFSYQSLTPEIQLDALASIGIYPETGLVALNSYENRVSLFTDENKIRYVVKFYRPQRWSDQQLLEEHQFCQELQQQGCNIAAPVAINQQTVFQFKHYYFALFKSLSARSLDIENIDQLYEVGRTLGKVHRIGAQKDFIYRQTLTIENMVSTPLLELRTSELIPKYLRQPLFTALDLLAERIKTSLSSYQAKQIRLHGDCHPSNILMNNEQPYLVDFDDCKMGPAIQDIWMLLHGDRQEQQLQLSMLLEGYQEEFDFDPKELRLIESLRGMRIINYLCWINKRWTDPAFPVSFPWFITEQYWKELLQSLQQQISLLAQEPLSLQPDY
ncbi:serine/threonine protein kinase [Psychromonas sp. MME2]|uniref:serine/threonine protein kinase n=1 Tax=unclassified Psychromonas TaxID=2614957 RepID=UPI00339BFBEB